MELKTSVTLFVFNPFTNDSRVLKEAMSLNEKDFDVSVFAHLGKNLNKKEIKNNILIRRFGYLDRSRAGKIKKLIAYFVFVQKGIYYGSNSNILHANDLNTLPIAVIIKKFFNKNTKIVYDAHEYEINDNPNDTKLSIKLKYLLEKTLIKYADAVITVSNSIADEYVRLYGIKRPSLVLNSPPYAKIEKTDIFRQKFNIKKDSIIMLYQGGLSKGRGLELLIEAFKNRKDDRVVMVFMGYGELEESIKEVSNKTSNIFFHPAVSYDELLSYTAAAAAAVSYIYDSCLNYYYCMPNKLFEYTMAGLPVMVSNLKDLSEVVKKYKIGVIVKEDTPEAINEAIDELLTMDQAMLRQNALKFAREHCWEKQEEVLLGVYKRMIS